MVTSAQLEQHLPAVAGHCYRMLGSSMDADDAVQETMIRAWKAVDRFDGRSSLKTWLHRIATNVCLDALTDRQRRARPVEEGPQGSVQSEIVERPRSHWLEPVADHRVIPADVDPAEQVMLRQSIRLAFVAALQHLPPKQRAVLLLTEVLGWSAAEAAEALETSVAAVNSALQRARATMAERTPEEERAPLTPEQSRLLDRYVSAFERYDLDTLTSLLREDATLSMPPIALWLQGHEAIRAWMEGPGNGCRGSKLLVTQSNGVPAFAQYRPSAEPGGPYKAWALIILELKGDRIRALNSFLDTQTLFPKFGLPLELRA